MELSRWWSAAQAPGQVMEDLSRLLLRTRELGVRMALGARASNAQMLVIAQKMKLALIGVPISMAASHVMKSMLFGLSARDLVTYGAVALLLAIVGLMACWTPAKSGESEPNYSVAA